MTAVRDTLCNLQRMEIPRPKCTGMQFIATRGRMGFYQSIRKDGEKFGIHIKPQGPRRPTLPSNWSATNPSITTMTPSSLCDQTVREEDEEPEEDAPAEQNGHSPKSSRRETEPLVEPPPDYNDKTMKGDRIALPVPNPPPAPPLSPWWGRNSAAAVAFPFSQPSFIVPRHAEMPTMRDGFDTAVGVKL